MGKGAPHCSLRRAAVCVSGSAFVDVVGGRTIVCPQVSVVERLLCKSFLPCLSASFLFLRYREKICTGKQISIVVFMLLHISGLLLSLALSLEYSETKRKLPEVTTVQLLVS